MRWIDFCSWPCGPLLGRTEGYGVARDTPPAVTALAWDVAGGAFVPVATGIFSIRREVLDLGRTWDYDADKVHGLRVSPGGAN